MAEELGIPPDEVAERCAEYYLHYGTTLAGLVAHGCQVDYQHWHDKVHASLPYEQYLKPDPALRDMLDSIPLPKVVFTNADRAHAARCLDLLGIAGCFRRVIAFEDVMEAAAEQGLVRHGCPVVCKPNRQAFDVALALAGGLQPSTTLWLDDRWGRQ
jgi:pyrimidine 5'-nucleotidase